MNIPNPKVHHFARTQARADHQAEQRPVAGTADPAEEPVDFVRGQNPGRLVPRKGRPSQQLPQIVSSVDLEKEAAQGAVGLEAGAPTPAGTPSQVTQVSREFPGVNRRRGASEARHQVSDSEQIGGDGSRSVAGADEGVGGLLQNLLSLR